MHKNLLYLIAIWSGFAWQLLPCSAQVDLWVSPSGSDANPGTQVEPLQSPAVALRKARELRRLKDPAVAAGVTITLRGGTYRLDAPLKVRPEDSGTESSPTVLQAAEGERPVLSGGIALSGWRKLEEQLPGLNSAARGSLWAADVPQFQGRPLQFRQLWVGESKATRAREPDGPTMARLTAWNREDEVAGIPQAMAGPYHDLSQLEMTILQMWEIAHLRVKSIQTSGDEAKVTFHQPESQLEFEHPWPQPVMGEDGAPFFLSGAIELLDQPGEWHLDRKHQRVLYWPREGEDLASAEVIVPALETLVSVTGSLDRPVSHVRFEGIGFRHTTWLRPSLQGHVPLQATMYLTEAYKLRPKGTPEWRSLDNQAWIGRPPAAVVVEGAQDTAFRRCEFKHLASTGIDYRSGTHDDLIEGCVFQDIGGNGIQLGSFQEGSIETHLAYNPEDEREICTRERIANNVVTDCANEDWGGVGICVGYGREVTIEHNEVFNHSYTGISLGWGWTRDENAMRDNRVVGNHIHHIATRMADTAAVYTLSAQPGTVIADNHIHDLKMSPYVHDPEHWFYLYLDEGSSHIQVKNNWCPADKFFENAVGPGNVWENNGPQVSEAVRVQAGLELEFRDLLMETRE